ncbi:MAG: nitrilase-related carbon-nitrogen hydrolase [Acidobacteriota bacterium]
MKVYLARWVCLDAETNLRRLGEACDEAVAAGAGLVVFPESFLHGYTRTIDPARVRAACADSSGRHPAAAFLFGSFTEEGRNRATVWRGGREVARYDKVHLFAPNGERELWAEGDRYAAVDLGNLRVGLLTCNDVRFPEQARALALEARCDTLVAVAWWPWRRDHVWRTLLRARAIENGVFVMGCCVAASESPGERFAGAGNHVFDPHGEPVRTDDDRVYTLDLGRRHGLVVDPLTDYRAIGRVEVFTAGEA